MMDGTRRSIYIFTTLVVILLTVAYFMNEERKWNEYAEKKRAEYYQSEQYLKFKQKKELQNSSKSLVNPTDNVSAVVWTNDFEFDDLIGSWKSEYDVIEISRKVSGAFIWQYKNGPEMWLIPTGVKPNGDRKYEVKVKGVKIPIREGTIDLRNDGSQIRTNSRGVTTVFSRFRSN